MASTRAPTGSRGKWCDKAEVIRAILEREAAGLALNHAAVYDNDHRLCMAIRRLFGTYDAALRAAGIDPARIRRYRRWSQRTVVERIRQRVRHGMPLNRGEVEKTEMQLSLAAQRHFGSWDDALVAAGIDPSQCRRRIPNWTHDGVIAAIREIQNRGGNLSHSAVKGRSLAGAAARLFGSWDAALEASGLSASVCRVQRRSWTPDSIVKEIQWKDAAGEALNARRISADALYHAAIRFFGHWDAALQAAGLDPERVRRFRKPWTQEALVAQIQQWHREGAALNPEAAFRAGLFDPARRLFGSWDAALLAAGLDPEQIRLHRKTWTRDEVLVEIKRDCTARDIQRRATGFTGEFRRAASRLFGSWQAALQAAEVHRADTNSHEPQSKLSRPEVTPMKHGCRWNKA